MKKKNPKKKEESWEIVNDLKRCLNIYYIFSQILKRQECIASEIMNETEICKATLYKYLNRAYDQELIGKKTNTNLYKNGAHFVVFSKPKLSKFLQEFKVTILNFLKNLPEFQEICDKKL
jgi:hypothetical protein